MVPYKLGILHKGGVRLVIHKIMLERGILDSLDSKKKKCCSYTAYNIKHDKPLRPPYLLQHATEHIQGKHIKEYVLYAGMHKNMCKRLPPAKQRRLPIMERQVIFKIDTPHTCGVGNSKHQHIDDDEIFDYVGYRREAPDPEIWHDGAKIKLWLIKRCMKKPKWEKNEFESEKASAVMRRYNQDYAGCAEV